jgi:RNA recognition motif-containing protein
VEYATREEAQNAVTTLSNQQLMGRLVYVREVFERPSKSSHSLTLHRIEKQNPDLHPPTHAAAVSQALWAAAAAAALATAVLLMVEAAEWVEVPVGASSTSQTFVTPYPFPVSHAWSNVDCFV